MPLINIGHLFAQFKTPTKTVAHVILSDLLKNYLLKILSLLREDTVVNLLTADIHAAIEKVSARMPIITKDSFTYHIRLLLKDKNQQMANNVQPKFGNVD